MSGPPLAGLYVLADDDPRWGRDPVVQAGAALRGGARALQLRAKRAGDAQALAWAAEIAALCRSAGALFFVNDRFDLALAAGADGVHLGQDDLPPARLPALARERLWVGRSTHTLEQARAARDEPVDYVAFGPVFGTSSKTSPYAARGLEALAEVARLAAPRPCVAIGGIDVANLPTCLRAGAAAVAVISAVAGAPDPEAAARARARGPDRLRVNELGLRAISAVGLVAMVAVAWALSTDRRRMPWRTVVFGLALQLGLALLLLKTVVGRGFFEAASRVVEGLTTYTNIGARFVFGPLMDSGFSILVNVLPVIVVMASLFSLLFYLGLVQPVVRVLAWVFGRTLGTSGAESLAAAAEIFVGMVESPLLVRPYVERMTRSELFALMATGMGTVAGSVMVVYAAMLGPEYAGHLLTASFLSAPGGLLLAKVMVPETGTPITLGGVHAEVERRGANAIDAVSLGAIDGLRLAGYIGAMLIAFVALVAVANDALAALGGLVGIEGLTFQRVLGVVFAPFAFLMGVPWPDVTKVASLLGIKTVLNEFIAYQELARLVHDGALSARAGVLASYALCGFANFGSLAILLGGLGGMVPSRRAEVAALGMRSIAAGTLATLMAGCWAGILL